jgi:hypothetical protein
VKCPLQVRLLESKVEETRLRVTQQMEALRAPAGPVERVCTDFALQVDTVVPTADVCAEQQHASERELTSTIENLQTELGTLRVSSTHLMKLYYRSSECWADY